MWSAVIVGPQPAAERSAAFAIGVIQPRMGPLIEQGAVESLDLAVGLGPVATGPLAPDAQPAAVSAKMIDSV
jgi:hypothetical protein